jgi:hypothetical protein
MRRPREVISRRKFIERSAQGVGLLAVGVGATRAAGAAVLDKSANPFAYDVERLTWTDPKLIRYEQVNRFASPHPQPRRIAIGPEDRLYIATRDGVDVLDRAGGRLERIGLTAPARCVAAAQDGTVYVGLREHIEVFDGKGERLATWESPGQKTWLTGLAVGESVLYAADSGSRVVWRYDRAGKLAGRVAEKSAERKIPGLIVPSPYLGVGLGRDGLLRVNNPGRHCVETYTAGGDLELSWGEPSGAIQGFCGCCNPVGLALLPDGRCVTCEKGLPRVKVYSATGTFECVVAGPETFPENGKAGSVQALSDGTMGGLDAAVDSEGRIYVLDLVAGDVRVMRRRV